MLAPPRSPPLPPPAKSYYCTHFFSLELTSVNITYAFVLLFTNIYFSSRLQTPYEQVVKAISVLTTGLTYSSCSIRKRINKWTMEESRNAQPHPINYDLRTLQEGSSRPSELRFWIQILNSEVYVKCLHYFMQAYLLLFFPSILKKKMN